MIAHLLQLSIAKQRESYHINQGDREMYLLDKEGMQQQ
jgi:hypothetical protein